MRLLLSLETARLDTTINQINGSSNGTDNDKIDDDNDDADNKINCYLLHILWLNQINSNHHTFGIRRILIQFSSILY